jgi:heterodisulfide reductase subunit A
VCGPQAIRFDQEDSFVTENVGAIVVATGYQLYDIGKEQDDKRLKGYGEYGYGTIPDVIDGLQFERLASASGPTSGAIRRPSDGKEPKTVVFLQCIGSRDPAKGIEYCSKICCMYVAKHAMLYRHKVHDGQAVVFYMDIRAGGKGYDEFVRRAIEEDGARYVRGRVSRMYRDGEIIKVLGYDTLNGSPVTIDADLVVLATAMRPQPGIEGLAQKLSVSYDKHGFINEAHPKLRPVETNTAGVYVAGACQAPRDIPDSVAMASAAAAKVLGLLSNEELEREPTIAMVNADLCAGCFHCERVCAYGAISHREIRDRSGSLIKVVAEVNPGVCWGCGTCQAACPSKSIELAGFTDDQIYAAINAFADL